MNVSEHVFVLTNPLTLEDLCPHCFDTDCSCEEHEYRGAFEEPRIILEQRA